MSRNVEQFSEDVVLELQERRRLGAFVPDLALEQAADVDHISDYDNLDVSECADLLISLSQL